MINKFVFERPRDAIAAHFEFTSMGLTSIQRGLNVLVKHGNAARYYINIAYRKHDGKYDIPSTEEIGEINGLKA